MANNHSETERRLWEAADQFRANSELKSSEYAVPVLGLIFLRYADHRFTQAEQELEGKESGRRKIGNMRNALPNAAFIGFTGTPLMAGEEKTKEVFGDSVHQRMPRNRIAALPVLREESSQLGIIA